MLYTSRAVLYPMLPHIGDSLKLSGTQQGAIASAYFFTYVAMQVPMGLLGDRLGLKRVLVAMYLLAGAGLLGVGFLSLNYTLLLAFMALHGLGASAYYSNSYGIAVSTVPRERRGFSSGFLSGGMALGLAGGLIISAPIYSLTGSWRAPFIAMAVITIAWGLLLRWALKPQRERGSWGLQGLGSLLRNYRLMALNLAAFCSLYGYWVIVIWGPSYFSEEKGLTLGVAGVFTAIVAIPSLLGALAMGPLSDRLGRKRLSLAFFPVAAACVAAIPFASNTLLLALALVFYGVFSAISWNPVVVAWAGDLALPSQAGIGTTLGVLNTMAMSASIVAPVVSGLVLDITGSLRSAFYLGAGMVFMATLFVLVPGEARES